MVISQSYSWKQLIIYNICSDKLWETTVNIQDKVCEDLQTSILGRLTAFNFTKKEICHKWLEFSISFDSYYSGHHWIIVSYSNEFLSVTLNICQELTNEELLILVKTLVTIRDVFRTMSNI